MAEAVIGAPELITRQQADLQVEVGAALAKIGIVKDALAHGQLQPHMDDRIRMYNVILSVGRATGYLYAPNPSFTPDADPRSFAVNFSRHVGGQLTGFELDATSDEPQLVRRLPVDNRTVHDPTYGLKMKSQSEMSRYSVTDLLAEPFYLPQFTKAADAAYKFAYRHLLRTKRYILS